MNARWPFPVEPWAAALHVGVDDRLGRLASVFGRLYAGGFGERLDELVARLDDFTAPTARVAIAWDRPTHVDGAEVRRGTFLSPAADLLPPESRFAVVERWLPRRDAPIVVLLAATAEESFVSRRPLARGLARRGIGTLILENPFYGCRRPVGQVGGVVRTLADQVAMNLATVREGCALVRTLHEDGVDVGVSGYSQGGVMAAFVAAICDFGLAAVPRAAPFRAEPVFTSAVLGRCVRWDVLASEAGDVERARARLVDVLSSVRLDRFPPPRDLSRAIVVGCRHDAWVPPTECEALHRHWSGAELRWIDGGHVAGAFLHHEVHVAAVADAVTRGGAS